MLSYKNNPPHTIQKQQFVPNSKTSWANIYDRYAPLMYGIILKMTGNQIMADEILEEVFVEIYHKKILAPDHTELSHSLLRHTFKTTLRYLEQKGQKVNTPFNEPYPLISMFYFEQTDLKDAALKLNLTEQEVLKNLRAEFNNFCNRCK